MKEGCLRLGRQATLLLGRLPIEARLFVFSMSLVSLASLAAVELRSFLAAAGGG